MKNSLLYTLLTLILFGGAISLYADPEQSETYDLKNITAQDLRQFANSNLGEGKKTELLQAIKDVPNNEHQIQLLKNENFESNRRLIENIDLVRAMPLTTSVGPATPVGMIFLTVTALLQAAVFAASGYLIYKLWAIILATLSEGNEAKNKLLLSLVGGIDASGEMTAATTKLKGKLKGAGLLGTISILAFACVAIYLLGRNNMLPATPPISDVP